MNFETIKLGYLNVTTYDTLIGKVIGIVFLLAVVLAFFYLVYAGFTYLTAGGNPDAAKKGQQGIINAIIGLVIIFLAYAIVGSISSLLGGTTPSSI